MTPEEASKTTTTTASPGDLFGCPGIGVAALILHDDPERRVSSSERSPMFIMTFANSNEDGIRVTVTDYFIGILSSVRKLR